MATQELERLNCTFEGCSALSAGAEPAEVVSLFRGHGGEFIDHLTREQDPDPVGLALQELRTFGWYNLSFRQRLLQLQVDDCVQTSTNGSDQHSRHGTGSFTCFPDTRTLSLCQNTCYPDTGEAQFRKTERAALGLLQFLNYFAPLLKPAYGYIMPVIDPQYDPVPSEAFRESGTLAYLCWANYFGPQIVAEVGEDFLSEAPGWRMVELPCGGFLYVVTESFLDWHFDKHRDIVRYFRQKFPDIEEL